MRIVDYDGKKLFPSAANLIIVFIHFDFQKNIGQPRCDKMNF